MMAASAHPLSRRFGGTANEPEYGAIFLRAGRLTLRIDLPIQTRLDRRLEEIIMPSSTALSQPHWVARTRPRFEVGAINLARFEPTPLAMGRPRALLPGTPVDEAPRLAEPCLPPPNPDRLRQAFILLFNFSDHSMPISKPRLKRVVERILRALPPGYRVLTANRIVVAVRPQSFTKAGAPSLEARKKQEDWVKDPRWSADAFLRAYRLTV